VTRWHSRGIPTETRPSATTLRRQGAPTLTCSRYVFDDDDWPTDGKLPALRLGVISTALLTSNKQHAVRHRSG